MINLVGGMLKQKFSLGEMEFFPFLVFKLKKIWKKISKKILFFTKIWFSELEKAYVQLFVLNFFSDFDLQKIEFWQFWAKL